jgi:hypothetical protein
VDILVFFKLGLASLVRLVVLVLFIALTCHQRVPDGSGKIGVYESINTTAFFPRRE